MAKPFAHLSVPRRVTALYIVLTELAVGGGPAPPVPPTSLLLARGTSPELAEQVEQLEHANAVTREGPLADALANERAALRSALGLAVRNTGLVLDPRVPRVVGVEPPPQLRSTDWFGFEHSDDEIRTHGLVRFGLPELRCSSVPAEQMAMYDAVLVGAAQRVIEEWPATDPVGPATITMRDVARGYGDLSAGGDDPTLARLVDLTIGYDPAGQMLAVTLHDDPAVALFAP